MRRCRWYDAYPRLAFAMQLLHLSPQRLRCEALEELSALLDEMTGPLQAGVFDYDGLHNRWYDDPADEEAVAITRLKAAPGRVKDVAAERLLGAISRCA
ncbi:MAG: hypothetical protein IPK79_01730 [Vampirovibrionales bacterium]|nr:hypothetical protein [Vampirovibrionales bacterium]